MLRILFLLLAVFIGGWVAWPAYSAYQIYGGMKAADEDVLQRKINWDSMRASLRPVVAAEVEKAVGKSGAGGLTGSFMPQIVDMAMKAIVTPKGLAQVMAHGGDVSSAVSSVVSKQMGKLGGLGALTGGGSDAGGGGGGLLGGLLGGGDKKGVGGVLGGLLGNEKVREMAGDKIGGVLGGSKKSEPDTPDQADEGPGYGLSNIKRFAYTGIGSMEVGVAKDPAAQDSDVTAVMEFQGFDWKLTGLVPRMK